MTWIFTQNKKVERRRGKSLKQKATAEVDRLVDKP